MKQEDIIRMAREADVNANANEPYRLAEETVAWLGHSAALVRAEALAQHSWVDLTDEEMKNALISVDAETRRLPPGFKDFARAIEAKLKEKNT
jgi:hypothetical protein